MKRKPFASFDLEISTDLGGDIDNWPDHAPLGISCAAVKLEDVPDVLFWQGSPRMGLYDCMSLLKELESISKTYDIIAWNGVAFDFHVLAWETDQFSRLGELALNSIDLMLEVVFRRGHYLGLDAALSGMNIGSKLHEVRLNSGKQIVDMSGKLAPLLWAAGESNAVLEYLKYDVIRPLELAQKIVEQGCITWPSKKGYPQIVEIDQLRKAKDLFVLPKPDTSWMTNPPDRRDFFSWIPDFRLEPHKYEHAA